MSASLETVAGSGSTDVGAMSCIVCYALVEVGSNYRRDHNAVALMHMVPDAMASQLALWRLTVRSVVDTLLLRFASLTGSIQAFPEWTNRAWVPWEYSKLLGFVWGLACVLCHCPSAFALDLGATVPVATGIKNCLGTDAGPGRKDLGILGKDVGGFGIG
ncbi:hypothetical protein Nepgr_006595 [Nepenthes gracilis]|uniref:Uncharacterized protein n=1 Tax=Nepenthes gracilis TaxID=150966 RepID=A0AAD3XHK9_NEPGR|nr:hypothetical protein Nepgr_006595 [Nepenthes gracilis]